MLRNNILYNLGMRTVLLDRNVIVHIGVCTYVCEWTPGDFLKIDDKDYKT